MLLESVHEEPEGLLLGASGNRDHRVGDGGGAVETFFLNQVDFDAHRL
jgi:hypothetical protein